MLAFWTVSAPHYAWKQIFLFVQHLNILKTKAALQVKLLIRNPPSQPVLPILSVPELITSISVLSAYNHLLYCANPRCMLQFYIKINDGGSWLHQHTCKYIRTHAHKSKHLPRTEQNLICITFPHFPQGRQHLNLQWDLCVSLKNLILSSLLGKSERSTFVQPNVIIVIILSKVRHISALAEGEGEDDRLPPLAESLRIAPRSRELLQTFFSSPPTPPPTSISLIYPNSLSVVFGLLLFPCFLLSICCIYSLHVDAFTSFSVMPTVMMSLCHSFYLFFPRSLTVWVSKSRCHP